MADSKATRSAKQALLAAEARIDQVNSQDGTSTASSRLQHGQAECVQAQLTAGASPTSLVKDFPLLMVLPRTTTWSACRPSQLERMIGALNEALLHFMAFNFPAHECLTTLLTFMVA